MAEGKETKKRIVLCPDCDGEVDLEQTEECPKCGLNVQVIIDKHRYSKAYEKYVARVDEESGGKRKKSKRPAGWSPF